MKWLWMVLVLAGLGAVAPGAWAQTGYEAQLPNESLKRPFAEQVPVTFVSRGQNAKEWDTLKAYFNTVEEEALDTVTGKTVKRKVIKIKLPLGINVLPQVPAENPITLAKWELGKKLYFDKILSSNGKVSCATCHDPSKGYSDDSKTSTGINGSIGGANAPTVINSVFNRLQFWDGRAASLEDQAQGPVGNNIEMFDGKGNAWTEAIKRIRASESYRGLFEKEFGHEATRDAAAKAIAAYERTVISGNSIQDRAELAARIRADEEESNKRDPQPKDYEKVLKEAFAKKDTYALKALGLDNEMKVPEMAKSISNGRVLFFNKARCNSCHVGETYTDHAFHNLGVGVKDGKLPEDAAGRFGAQATGHKDPSMYGAFKTPQLRGLVYSKPYMHDGSEKTLEQVVDFYDKGGNANEFLDTKMRDVPAEQAYAAAKAAGNLESYKGSAPKVFTRGGWPIIPLELKLTPDEKKDLVNFMKALEGDPFPKELLE